MNIKREGEKKGEHITHFISLLHLVVFFKKKKKKKKNIYLLLPPNPFLRTCSFFLFSPQKKGSVTTINFKKEMEVCACACAFAFR